MSARAFGRLSWAAMSPLLVAVMALGACTKHHVATSSAPFPAAECRISGEHVQGLLRTRVGEAPFFWFRDNPVVVDLHGSYADAHLTRLAWPGVTLHGVVTPADVMIHVSRPIRIGSVLLAYRRTPLSWTAVDARSVTVQYRPPPGLLEGPPASGTVPCSSLTATAPNDATLPRNLLRTLDYYAVRPGPLELRSEDGRILYRGRVHRSLLARVASFKGGRARVYVDTQDAFLVGWLRKKRLSEAIGSWTYGGPPPAEPSVVDLPGGGVALACANALTIFVHGQDVGTISARAYVLLVGPVDRTGFEPIAQTTFAALAGAMLRQFEIRPRECKRWLTAPPGKYFPADR